MERSERLILSIAGGIFAILTIVTLIVISGKSPEEEPKPKQQQEFLAPAFEANAEQGTPELTEEEIKKLRFSNINMADTIYVSMCGSWYLHDENLVDVYFASSDKNTAWIRLIVYSEDGSEMGSTGVLKPGEYVQSLTLNLVPTRDCNLKVKVVSYQPETYYSEGTASASVSLYVQ